MNKSDIYYRTLGLEPGASPKEVKHAYRELAKTWHPDHFSQTPHLQQQALEKIKVINHAYTKLRALRSGTETNTAHTMPTSSPGRTQGTPGHTLGTPTWLVALIVFVVLRLFYDHVIPDAPFLSLNLAPTSRLFPLASPGRVSVVPEVRPSQKIRTVSSQTTANSERPALNTSTRKSLRQSAPPPSFFTVGSTKDEVLAIQGSPTHFSRHVWEYGGSRVYFRNERVTHWEIWSRSPLKAQLRPTTVTPITRSYFTVGSTKDEVLTIQGSPTRFSQRVWEYGYSRVYFNDDRVTRWEAWRSSPLKAR